ncbi:Global transcription factor group isoform 1 [Hibiscus syriacus]|uniref:Global transcription factor group isoform 1 n=1 Tax=Hibiscus syriacus TaxID=106335 RepID=A0A6A2YH60_HIBSY|nr:Global transcription factor group isoform 1 [Hibiscus syriacus]
MGAKANAFYNVNQEEIEETLSLCDFSLENQDLDDQSLAFNHSPNSPYQDHQLFEFPFIPNISLKNNKSDVVFCGKLIQERDFVADDGDQNKSLSPLSSFRRFDSNKNDLGSLYSVNSKPNSSLSAKICRSQSFSSVKQRKALIGVTKIPQKMELSDLKRRQSRRNHPLPMFPPRATGDKAVVDAGDGRGVKDKRSSLWSLLRPSRCGAHAFNTMNKSSLGCISHV